MSRHTEKLTHPSEQTLNPDIDQPKKRLTLKRVGGAAAIGLALSAGGYGMSQIESTKVVEGHAKAIEMSQPTEEQMLQAAHDVGHRYDGGCEITSIKDLHRAPEEDGGRTTITVGLRMHRTPAAEAAMRQYASPQDYRVEWSKPVLTSDVYINGNSVGPVSTPDGLIGPDINEQFGLVQDTDGSYVTSVNLTPRTDDPEHTVIRLGIHTDARHGDKFEESNVRCAGKVVFENGSWVSQPEH